MGGLLLVCLANALIDPLRLTPLVSLPGFNAEKPHGHKLGQRVVKSVHLALGDYDAWVLGTSRAGALFSPEHPFFRSERVYNAALMQSSMVEIAHVFDYAARHQDLDTVLIGLDFAAFNARRRTSGDFSESGFAGHSPWWLLAKSLPSGQTLELSFHTLAINLGLESPSDEASVMAEILGEYANDARVAFRFSIRYFLRRPDLYGCYLYDRERVEILGRIVRAARAGGARVVLLISPVHALQLETMRAVDLFEAFEQWKRDLTAVVGAEAPLWDFSGYNAFTTEPLPEEKGPMRWYTESSHYRPELGQVVLDRLAEPDGGPSDFGTRLTRANVESHLESTRTARERYAADHPERLEMIATWAVELEPERLRRCRRRR